jgi:hypothetical protein
MTQEMIDRSRKRHTLTDTALFGLIAALAMALVVAAIVVSIGIARTDTLGPIAGSGGGRVALAVALGLLIAGMGGVAAALVHNGETSLRHD